jgi:hypothetical protein
LLTLRLMPCDSLRDLLRTRLLGVADRRGGSEGEWDRLPCRRPDLLRAVPERSLLRVRLLETEPLLRERDLAILECRICYNINH